MEGQVGILNVGAGDTKLSFDPNNPQDCIRAARIVKDMLRRGYALLVEIEQDGKKIFKRATDFIEGTFEYVIADLDPLQAQRADQEEAHAQDEPAAETAGDEASTPREPKNGRRKGRRIPATRARAVAVPHVAGG